ncbi:transposase zinc-binding domain-containing protein [Sorangium sp. So ce233]|uniref:transposase zinc-binding domain-containing protein n=1 Tax=Sorangium sp. So ce233 TaxID=3133290 RepID=UPI003F5D8390
MASAARTTGVVYERRRPEKTTLYEIVRDNVETLYGAIDDGAIAVRIPKHAKKELEAYLDCGLLRRGFARLRCERCEESRLVAFSCKGRGFCPSCLGRRMCSTAANLIEDVLPEVALRQRVLTFPWRRRLAQDGALFGVLTRLFVESVGRFYEERAARRGACGAAKSGAVTDVQRTSGDMRLNPNLHVVFLDGAYHEDGTELLGHLRTREVGQVLALLRHFCDAVVLRPRVSAAGVWGAAPRDKTSATAAAKRSERSSDAVVLAGLSAVGAPRRPCPMTAIGWERVSCAE